MLGRTNNLPHTEYTKACVVELASTSGVDSYANQLVAWKTRINRVIERADDASRDKRMDTFIAASILEALVQELGSIYASIPGEAQATRKQDGYFQQLRATDLTTAPATFQIARLYAEMKVYAIALNDPSFPDVNFRSRDDDQSWRFPAIIRCFEVTKTFFNLFTSIPVAEYRSFSFVELWRLIKGFNTMSALCQPVPCAPQWDAAWAREDARFGMTIESICYRMGELTSTGKQRNDLLTKRSALEGSVAQTSPPPDHFFMFKSVLLVLKEVYEEAVSTVLQATQAEAPPLQTGSRCPMLNGSMTGTDYWEALQYSNMMTLESDNMFDAELIGLGSSAVQ